MEKTCQLKKLSRYFFIVSLILLCLNRISVAAMPAWLTYAKSDVVNLPSNVWEDSKYTFTKTNNLIALLGVGGASIAMHSSGFDKNLDDREHRPRMFHGSGDELFNIIGSPATHFAATGIWYAISAQNKDELGMEQSWTMIRALSLTGIVTLGLKAAVHNETPNHQDWAWPSGHTASSFAVASVLDEFYGPNIGIPAYVVAGLVGYRMMDSGDHWASDVLFGAVLGWVVGHSVAQNHKNLEVGGFQVLPYSAPTEHGSIVGVNFVRQF